jgi:5-methylcytosine-specific restriction protein A
MIPHPCAAPGCPALVTDGGSLCPTHCRARAQAHTQRRGTVAQRGYNARWTRFSRAYRASHPLCVLCTAEGRTTLSAHVDHIRPVSGADDPGFYDPANLRALCRACHSRVTAQHDGGFGNPHSPKGTD